MRPLPARTASSSPARPGRRYLLVGRPLQQLRADIGALPELPPPEVAPGLEQRLQPHIAGGITKKVRPGPLCRRAGLRWCCRGAAGPRLGRWGGAPGPCGRRLWAASEDPPVPVLLPAGCPATAGTELLSAGPLPASASRGLITLVTESTV